MKVIVTKRNAIFSLVIISVFITPGVSLSGWSFFVSTQEECVDKYLSKTKCNFAARVVYYACSSLYGDREISSDSVNYWNCALEEAIPMKNDTAAKIALGRCSKRHLPPPSPKTKQKTFQDGLREMGVHFEPTKTFEDEMREKGYLPKN